MTANLKLIYSAATENEALVYLDLFAEKWDRQYGSISKLWRTNWSHVMSLFAFPEDIGKVIYTTNAIELVNMSLRKVARNHRIFPSDEAVYKVVYLAMHKNGPCPFATGSQHLTVSLLHLGSASPNKRKPIHKNT